MNSFGNTSAANTSTQSQVPAFGSGRHLHSDLPLANCLTNLEAILLSYRPLDNRYKTPYVIPGWRWLGEPQYIPHIVTAFADSNPQFLIAAFWPNQSGTNFGLFPLGSGDARLSALPIIGHWKQRDRSLTSVGVLPEGQICLAPPRVPEQFVEEIFQTAGYPPTPHNVAIIGMMMGRMFVGSARQSIAPQDPSRANDFVQAHVAEGPFAEFYRIVIDEEAAWSDGRGTGHFSLSPTYTAETFSQFYQTILNDVAAWRPFSLPSLQDVPMRIRAVALEGASRSIAVWGDLER